MQYNIGNNNKKAFELTANHPLDKRCTEGFELHLVGVGVISSERVQQVHLVGRGSPQCPCEHTDTHENITVP